MYAQLDEYIENMKLRKFNVKQKKLITNCNKTFKQIRDIIVQRGSIIEENEVKQIYVFTIQSGKFGNHAVVALGLKEKVIYLAAFSKEGLLKQYTCERALKQIGDILR